MACENPLLALDLGVDADGKRHIKILPKRVGDDLKTLEYRYGPENILALPCGKCMACKEAYRKQWTERCVCESKLYKDNCFLTITYNDVNCPTFLRKHDLDVFIRELRRMYKVRYFGCGEYGSQTVRPHYHLVLFGYFPEDARPYGTSDNGVMLYTSKFLEDLWNKGFVIIEEFHPNNAAYVAGYVGKKLSKDTVYEDHPEFICMSRRPGIGYEYLITHKDEYLQYQHFIGPNGRIMRLGRYAEKIIGVSEEVKIKNIDALRMNENKLMNLYKLDYREQLWYRKGKEVSDRVNRRRRKIC